MTKILLLMLLFLFSKSHSQESPKNIIAEENNRILYEENYVDEKNSQVILEEDESKKKIESLNENQQIKESDIQNKMILIEDLPNNFNQWYGILSSDKGGLGWMMWENTSYSLSKKLIQKINPSSESATLNKLLKNLLLSRAKAPNINNNENLNALSSSHNKIIFPYLENKIGYLVQTGYSNDINHLLKSIPKDFKKDNFQINNFDIRLNNFDIPYLCNNVSKMLSLEDKLTIYRKILIVCKFVLKKEEEAMLAMELLENDILEEDNFLKKVRNLIDNQKIKINVNNEEISKENNLLKILYFYDYEASKILFKDMPRIFHKTVYDLKLFSDEIQLESLEFLVDQGIYQVSELIEKYNTIISDDELISFISSNQTVRVDENSVLLRATLFKLINKSVSNTERAKYIKMLWDLGNERNILKAISLAIKNNTLSLYPDEKLNWFNYIAFKSLLLSNEIEAAKKWIFYGTSDAKERAKVDVNFCKLLIMLYLYDNNAKFSYNEFIDISYLLKTLDNDLNVDQEDLLKLILTIKAFDGEVPEVMWETFIKKQILNEKTLIFFRHEANKYFLLDEAVKKENLAKAALLSINLLQSESGLKKDFYSYYKGLNGLFLVGLGQYARQYAIEENFSFLSNE